MIKIGLLARSLLIAATAAICVGCSVSVHSGNGDPQAEQVYRRAITQPFNNLTVAASNASQTCAGGKKANPQQCYLDTNIEIASARAVERALKSVPIPPRFAKANTDLLHGLGIFVTGLAKRNAGLGAHSSAEYSAGESLINKGLAIQKSAFAEYPADANIVN